MSSHEQTLPLAASSLTDDEVLEHGQLFGRYLVIEAVGSGGVGQVFAVYDPALDRRVALKLLRRSTGETHSSGESGLVREAKALASVSHPHVVTVHDVGRNDGRYYVVMELVEGRDLNAWLADDSASHTWRDILSVFIDAGRGLAAVHARGLLHRDFKPSNVLVGRDGWVRVSDFGLATLLGGDESIRVELEDEISLTETLTIKEKLVGTPYFMAPEQFAGRASVQSDVYAYCLSLRDALYGSRTFQAETVGVLASIKSSDVESPSVNPRGVPTRIRRILDRGLRADPDARWSSVNELLHQLDQVRAPSTRRTLPWLVGLGGLTAAVGFALSNDTEPACNGASEALTTTWDDARRRGVVAALEHTSSPIADATIERALPRLDRFGEVWTEVHTDVCEATQRREQSQQLLDIRMRCLQRQLANLDAVARVLEDADAEVVARAVQLTESLPSPPTCAAQMPREDADTPTPALEQARDEYAAVAALTTAARLDEAAERSEALVAAATELGNEAFLAEALYARGDVLQSQGDTERATEVLERAVFAGIRSNNQRLLLEAGSLLAVVESRAGRPREGLRWSRLADAVLTTAIERPQDRCALLHTQGVVHAIDEDYSTAERMLREAIDLDRTQRGRAIKSQDLASVLLKVGRFDEAIAIQKDVLATLEDQLGPQHPLVADGYSNLAVSYASTGALEDAEMSLRRSLEIVEHTLGPQHPSMTSSLGTLAVILHQRGDVKQAIAYFERGIEVLLVTHRPTHPEVIGQRCNLASVLVESGESERGHEILDELLRQVDANPDIPDATRVQVLSNTALAFERDKAYNRALELSTRALEIEESLRGKEHPALLPTLNTKGSAYDGLGRHAEALELHERAFEIGDRTLEPDNHQLLVVLLNLVTTHLELEQFAAAKERAELLLARAKNRPDHSARGRYLLARAVGGLGDRALARSLVRQALASFEGMPELSAELPEVQAFANRIGG